MPSGSILDILQNGAALKRESTTLKQLRCLYFTPYLQKVHQINKALLIVSFLSCLIKKSGCQIASHNP